MDPVETLRTVRRGQPWNPPLSAARLLLWTPSGSPDNTGIALVLGGDRVYAGVRGPERNLGTMRPGRRLKWLLRAPVALYSAHAGWLLGHRFLLLAHRGRRTGRVYRTVLEVVAWDEVTREAVVMSGFGSTSQWYRNVLASDPVEVRIARLQFAPRVRQLDAHEAARVLAGYEERNRIAAVFIRAVLSKLAGFRYDGSESARRSLVQVLPLVGFRPRD